MRILASIGILALAGLAAAAQPEERGFVTLFNGKDLTGWKTAPTSRWVVDQGALTLKDRSDGKEHNLEYLWRQVLVLWERTHRWSG